MLLSKSLKLQLKLNKSKTPVPPLHHISSAQWSHAASGFCVECRHKTFPWLQKALLDGPVLKLSLPVKREEKYPNYCPRLGEIADSQSTVYQL